ncbi:alpha-ketoglutaric semialdehyde dehydrogenase GucD [Ammoniphilus sp. 3BR4]|uniref:alpha-ketoglutaric semialdehyde dehydrogenase GucD n=1 Tax=Ammoniphilus sp. 3BR4 TaxID=3158265 RepID=UPI0034665E83
MAVKTEVRKYQNLINGQWVDALDQEVEASVNPADYREIVGYVPLSGPADVDHAIQAAKSAFPQWKKLTGATRGDFLRKAADILEQRVDDIAETLTREMGKTLAEARGETLRGVAILRYYAAEGMRSVGEVIPSSDEDTLLFTTRTPVGVVGLITPWNFPVAIPIWKLAPALIYGNTVVMKPALEATVTATKVMECIQDAGFPPGVVNMVSGKGSTVGNIIVDHPEVKAISFTGSNQVGQGIALKALQRGAKYQLEMGGKNPVIVSRHADLDLAAELTVSGSMRSSGQKCTATSRAIIVKEVYEAFREKVIQKMKSIKVGDGLQANTYMGPVASQNQFNNVLDAIKKGIDEGGSLVLGGKPLNQEERAFGYFIEPTLFENIDPNMWIAQEEIFGPVLVLIQVDSLEDAFKVANDVKYGLSASIFTDQLNEVFQYLNQMEAGMIRVNGESSGVELQAPFGGVKASSTQAREQGRAAMEFFTSVQTVTIKP